MIGKVRASIIGALIVSVVGVQTPVFASTEEDNLPQVHEDTTPVSASTLFDHTPRRVFSEAAIANATLPVSRVLPLSPSSASDVLAQRYYGRRHGGGRRATAITAIVLGSAAAITGGALLAYANRPECSANSMADGCGYGFKVIGGSVLAGGLVGVTVGALTWPH